jgi:hypothetical protein
VVDGVVVFNSDWQSIDSSEVFHKLRKLHPLPTGGRERGRDSEGRRRGRGRGRVLLLLYMLSRFVRALLQGAQTAEARPEDAASKAKPGFILKLGG